MRKSPAKWNRKIKNSHKGEKGFSEKNSEAKHHTGNEMSS